VRKSRSTFVALIGVGALIGAAVLQSITAAPDAAARRFS
jgi:hypothetical protein